MRQISRNKHVVETWRGLDKRAADLAELIGLAEEAPDSKLETEIRAELTEMTAQLEALEFQLVFKGEHEDSNAILAIHAGAGGTESQDWADMLMRMYLRWAERRGYHAEVMEVSPGEEVGIKSVMIEVAGDYAYGYLKGEHGVHRLVRLSPFDADHARHTSFALVEILPEAEENVDIVIDPKDLRLDVFRSSGPGGQHMQKTSTAVRITHEPSGLVVTCQSQRSQHQNKDLAMKVLQARLLERELARKKQERSNLKGERIDAGWGSQIRSYVLHPYKMVKDHRTSFQTGNPDAVLEGDLDGFINSYLRSRVGETGD
jgi:peptide chain release factor 2